MTLIEISLGEMAQYTGHRDSTIAPLREIEIELVVLDKLIASDCVLRSMSAAD